MDGLIGYTGFVGSNINSQHCFNKVFNSKNIEDIINYEFDLLVCAGISGVKWIANNDPERDLLSIERLLNSLENTRCKKLLMISTIDVYSNPNDVDETNQIYTNNNHHYGIHRAYVEQFVSQNFRDYSIVRLPALFGRGIKKNFIFDMLNNHCLEWTHRDTQFQYYDLGNIWKDISIVLNHALPVVNICSEPISARDVAGICFGMEFDNITERAPEKYDVKTIYANYFGSSGSYTYSRKQIINELTYFIAHYKDTKEVLK